MVTPWHRQVFGAQKIGRVAALSISGRVALKIKIARLPPDGHARGGSQVSHTLHIQRRDGRHERLEPNPVLREFGLSGVQIGPT
jgi:hypothetical protein